MLRTGRMAMLFLIGISLIAPQTYLFHTSVVGADVPPAPAPPTAKADFVTRTLHGKVVWLAAAMDRLHGVKSVSEATERILGLETREGNLHPIVEDVRGRAFRVDERLRGMTVELLVRQFSGSPLVQIIGVNEVDRAGVRWEVDYWCEICAIAMYELKPCECCQGNTELRKRRVK